MYFVYLYNKRLAKKINNSAVMATAKDNISDAWVSLGPAAGIFGSQLNMPWIDRVAALIVGLLICKTAREIFREASHELSDGFDVEKIEHYKGIILSLDEYKNLKDESMVTIR